LAKIERLVELFKQPKGITIWAIFEKFGDFFTKVSGHTARTNKKVLNNK